MKKILFEREINIYSCETYADHNEIRFEEKLKEAELFGNNFNYTTLTKPTFQLLNLQYTKESFDTNYKNPLTRVYHRKGVVLVEEDVENEKVSIKLFTITRHRSAGSSWVRTHKLMSFITVNKKTGDVYIGDLVNYHLKRKFRKKLIRNCFINKPLSSLINQIRNVFSDSNQEVKTDYGVSNEAGSIFINEIDKNNFYGNLTPNDRLFKFYLSKRNIKFPNNFNIFYSDWFGPEIRKLAKKNDNRMVDALMLKHGLSGKQIKKALHECNHSNYEVLKFAIQMFGKEWVNQDYELILGCLNFINYLYINDEFVNSLTKEELKRVFEIFKEVVVNSNIDYYSFSDHIMMYVRLKQLGEVNLKWMSSQYGKINFRDEHLDWSDKLEHYTKGFYTRKYPEYSYELIEKPIISNNQTYYPVLLNDSTNYNSESSIQSNCVKNYIVRCPSIIISLRLGDVDSEIRATIEYQIYKQNNVVNTKRVQTLGRFNNDLSDEWTDVLFSLDEIMLNYVKDSRFKTVKIEKVCKNGTKFFSDSEFSDNNGLSSTEYLNWTYNTNNIFN